MTNLMSLFLSQSYKDCVQDYERVLKNPKFPRFDYIILTASNEFQAQSFRAQLETRRGVDLLPEGTHFAVVPDEGGKRVGSGGATLAVIKYIAEHRGSADFSGLRILVIHSGGDSKRVPQYSAIGKLFSPVPRVLPSGNGSTLFDEFLIATASIPSRIKEGMLLLSGDVLLLFNPLQIDHNGSDATAISFKESVHTGKNHGVFLKGENGNVKLFLHKQTEQTLASHGAVNAQGQVDIDTGAVIFSADMLASLYNLISSGGSFDAGKYFSLVNDRVRLSLYGDFLYPLATDATLESFYAQAPEGQLCDELIEAREKVWNALRKYRLKLVTPAPAKFIHFGTTKEILALMCGEVRNYRELDWCPKINSSINGDTAGYNSVLSEKAQIGSGCYLEVSYVHRDAKVGNNVLLSYIDIHDEAVPDNVVLHGLKQKNGKFVCRIYGVDDNPKSTKLFGVELCELVKRAGVSVSDIWDGDANTLWEAKLYPECTTITEAVSCALELYDIAVSGKSAHEWIKRERRSLCSGFNNADPDAIIAWNVRMCEIVQMDEIAKDIKSGKRALDTKRFSKLSRIQDEWLAKRLQKADFGEKIRLHYYIGTALGGIDGEREIAKCFSTIADTILEACSDDIRYNDRARIVKDRHVVKLPLRVNFGGGWSDTPPYCNERGGTVINAAIKLGGEYPVEVTLQRIADKKVVFDSRDMDVHGEFDTIEGLQLTGDPYDPFALQKACLLACGIIPANGGDLGAILDRLGGGFIMKSEVTGVPKGSGLGTSSILSAACVKAIFEFMGIEHTTSDLYRQVLVMEQIMSTGGGWQDQVGGITGGIKFITSAPGICQDIQVSNVNISDSTKAELNSRLCLIYTGQRRLARNLLREVVGRYVGNEPDSLYALNEIQRVAALMRFELERGNVDEFAALLDYHWKLSKMVDEGSTNTLIEQIFASIDDLIDGRLVCGAGGGGFLQVILKKGVSKNDVHKRLKDVFSDNPVDIWDSEIV